MGRMRVRERETNRAFFSLFLSTFNKSSLSIYGTNEMTNLNALV